VPVKEFALTPPAGDARESRDGMVRAVGAIGLATLLSRVLGYVRDMVVAHVFGAGPVTDAFFVAFRIPNLFRRLLAEGALSSALIPVFTGYLARGGGQAFNRMARAVLGAGTGSLVLVSAAGVAAAPWIVAVLTPGWTADRELLDLAVRLTRIMFPYLLLVGLAALATGVLNAHHRFVAAAAGPAVLNVGIIAGVLLLAGRLDPPVLSLAVGVLAGGLGQLLVQLPGVRRLGVPLAPSAEWCHPAVREIGLRLVPAVFGLAAVQVAVLVNTLLASLLPGGTVSYLYYADRIMEFPLGVFGIAVATAVLPTMSAQAARGESAALVGTVGFSLRLSAFVTVPAAAGLLALGEPIVRLLFLRGRFGDAEAAATAQALLGYAVGLPAFAATRLLAQAFYALGDPRRPVLVGLGGVALNVVLAVLLMRPLAHAGLALASSLTAYANLAVLAWLLRRRLGRLEGRATAVCLVRVLAASTVVAAACAWAAPVAPRSLGEGAHTLAVVAGGAALYLGLAALLRAPELRQLRALGRR
jgi:putative peptidoglycan lipid II flippase